MTRIAKKRVKNGTKELQKILRSFKGKSKVKVGFPSSVDGEIIDKAVYNEFGTRDIPERPFIRNGLRDGVGKITDKSKIIARKVVAGKLTTNQGLNQLGVLGSTLVKENITSGSHAPNAQSTIDQKGSATPLIDTNEMRLAVTWKVE